MPADKTILDPDGFPESRSRGRRSLLEKYRPELSATLDYLVARVAQDEERCRRGAGPAVSPGWRHAIVAARAFAARVYVDVRSADSCFERFAQTMTPAYIERVKVGWALWHAVNPLIRQNEVMVAAGQDPLGTFFRTPEGDLLDPAIGAAVRHLVRTTCPALMPWMLEHFTLGHAFRPTWALAPHAWSSLRIAAWGWGEAVNRRHEAHSTTLRDFSREPVFPFAPHTSRPMPALVWLDLATRPDADDASAPRTGLHAGFFTMDGDRLVVAENAQPTHIGGPGESALAATRSAVRKARLLAKPVMERRVVFMTPEAAKWNLRVDLSGVTDDQSNGLTPPDGEPVGGVEPPGTVTDQPVFDAPLVPFS